MAGRNLRGVGLAFFCALFYSGASAFGATPLLGPAPPVPPAPAWTCEAHAAIVNIGGASGLTLDPLHANSTNPPNTDGRCHDAGATVPDVAANDILGQDTVTVTSGNAQAQTGITNGGGPTGAPPPAPTNQQAPAAAAQIDNTELKLGGPTAPGTLDVTAKAVRSYVTGTCKAATQSPLLSGGNPVIYPSGRYPDGSLVAGQVVDLRINGTPIPADGEPDQTLTMIVNGINNSPLSQLVKIVLNHETTGVDPTTGETFLRREAVRIELLNPGSGPTITVILGSATVNYKDTADGKLCAGATTSVAPPLLIGGSNQPGSNGGGQFGGSSSSTSTNVTKVFNNAANGNNASECAHIRAYFDLERAGKPSKSGPVALSSRTGIRHVIRGVVRNCKGQAITKAKIELVNIIHGKRHLVKTGLRTRAGGHFTMITPNNYTSRTLEFQYRAFLNDPKIAARAHLRIKVRNFRGQLT